MLLAESHFNGILVETKYLKSSEWFCFRYCFERCFCAARFTSESNRVSDGCEVFGPLKKWEAPQVFMASGAGSSSRNRRSCWWRIGEASILSAGVPCPPLQPASPAPSRHMQATVNAPSVLCTAPATTRPPPSVTATKATTGPSKTPPAWLAQVRNFSILVLLRVCVSDVYFFFNDEIKLK